ncbi:MAG: nuclear transport factor 2 family protein [Winogradskyella sp.]|uniref:nuclear transport factor 2 family protein n=1 Tax=Winogradskyella sp. TaxID=1883156 RepID=UPI0017BB2C4B|nr:nuclear transport factor 2 family protein [Winogradskyella sp.]
MKNLIYILSIVLLCVSCQEHEQRYFAESDEINTLKSGIDAYESGDWDQWKSHFADTAKIYVNTSKGIDVNQRLSDLQNFASAFATYGFNHDDEYIEMVLDKEKETWVYYWAEHRGKLNGSDKELSIPVHLAVRFSDGKIVAEHIYFDGTELNKEMEAMANKTDMEASTDSSMN